MARVLATIVAAALTVTATSSRLGGGLSSAANVRARRIPLAVSVYRILA
jgi:hypothetical protein